MVTMGQEGQGRALGVAEGRRTGPRGDEEGWDARATEVDPTTTEAKHDGFPEF